VIWLRFGNNKVAEIENIIRNNFEAIAVFINDPGSSIIDIY